MRAANRDHLNRGTVDSYAKLGGVRAGIVNSAPAWWWRNKVGAVWVLGGSRNRRLYAVMFGCVSLELAAKFH